ncbi:MAG: 2,3-diphosphoglycerate-dependent phosphoglycerate mutase, partial [Acidimicrobiia bacterium]|nr:2,3-diphosphoglycerate-dependent phosphoglycerate mutase [Acidimicrobiia bacterium]
QSVWNLENVFTGWTDVGLTDKGRDEAQSGGRLLAENGFAFDIAHTSVLLRAIETLDIVLRELGQHWIPVRKHWRLNERHYGALQGRNKQEMADEVGSDQVHIWRRSYDTPPPPLETSDDRHPINDPRYSWMPPDLAPATECLADVVDRMLPYWYDAIVPDLRAGKRVVVAAHGNSLRALVKHLDGISDDEIPSLNIPTGVPLVYRLNSDLEPIESRYLGDADAVAAAAQAVADQVK